MGELIAVLSGKGGTGKTSVCAALAQALCLSGESVLCIDCDVQLRNLDIALGLSEDSALSFTDVCSGTYELDAATRHHVYPNLAFLTAPVSTPAAQVDQDAFSNMLQTAREKFSYVLLDAPAGVEAGFSLAAAYADRILLVSGADPASVRDAARAADLLELMEKPEIRLIVNRDAHRAGQMLELMGKTQVRLIVNRVQEKRAKQMKLTIDDIMDQAGLPLIGLVPEDPDVTLAANFKQPLLGYTRKGAAEACRRIARRIQGFTVPIRVK